MTQDDLKLFLNLRITQLVKIKNSIGDTGSRSSQLAIEWIDGLIAINQNLLNKLLN